MASAKYDLHIENYDDQNNSLVLVRFPAMRSQFDNDPDQIELELKPKSMTMKLAVALDTHTENYNQEQAQVLGGKSIPKTFVTSKVDKNFYSTTKMRAKDDQLFVAQVVNDKLVCRPLSHILAMRADFSHFDVKDEPDVKEEIRPVSVKFAGPERATNLNAAGSSTSKEPSSDINSDHTIPDDPVTMKYYSMDSREARKQRIFLFGEQLPKVKPDPDAEPKDVKPHLPVIADAKPKIETTRQNTVATENQPQMRVSQIRSIVKQCLQKAKIVSFDETFQFIRENAKEANQQINAKDILDALNDYALLVQGNWAIKSEILYGDSSERDSTDVTGISINLLSAARDYLIWLFTQNRIVSRLDYTRRVRIPDHDVLEVFNQLAEYRDELKRWELKLPTDDRFLREYPEVVQKQDTFWKVRRANKLSFFER